MKYCIPEDINKKDIFKTIYIVYQARAVENESLVYRRLLYVVKHMKPGDIFSSENLRSVRPIFGLSTKYSDFILGKTIIKSAKRGTPVSWDLLIE